MMITTTLALLAVTIARAGGEFPDGTPFSINFTVVDRSLTALSWKLSNGSDIGNSWIHHALDKAVYRKPDRHVTTSTSCAVEVLGISINGYDEETLKDSTYELSYAMTSLSSTEVAEKSNCSLYREFLVPSVKRRRGKRGDITLLYFFCPVFKSVSCSKLESSRHKMSLAFSGLKSAFEFETNSPNLRKSEPLGVGVCAFDNSDLKSDSLDSEKMKAFMSHYSSLGFERVIIYSSSYMHINLSSSLNPNLLSWPMSIDIISEIRKTSIHFQTDLFLSVALSFCRFELSMLVRDVLVLSTDDFLYCPAAIPTYLEQNKALSKLLSSNFQTMAFDSVTLPSIKDVPPNAESNYYSRFASQEFECMKRFEFDRSLHRGHICPHTSRYASCTASGRPADVKCWCTVRIQRSCELFRLSQNSACVAADKAIIRSYDLHLRQFEMFLIAEGNDLMVSTERRNYSFSNSLSVLSQLAAIRSNSQGAFKNTNPYYQGFSSRLHMINSQSKVGRDLHCSIKGIPPSCSLGDIHVFYVLTPRASGRNVSNREINVQKAVSNDSQTSYFSALFHTPWTVIKKLFKNLKIPTSHMFEPFYGKSKNRRGKYARWASLVLALSYAVQNRLGHIILLEDDTVWPSGFFLISYTCARAL